MPKRLFILGILLGSALLLCACQHLTGGAKAPAPTGITANATVPSAPLSYLYFSESSSCFKRVQGYEYRMEEDGPTAYFHMAHEEECYPVPVGQEWADTLNGFVIQYGMMGWDGFSGSANGLLDGTQFCMEFTLADGTNVKAGGYGEFPDGYGSASKAIDEHFIQLLPQEMRDW